MSGNQSFLYLDQVSKYSTFISQGQKDIDGWLDPVAIEFAVMMAEIQRRAGWGSGPVCEIGVWQGKFLTLLTYLTETDVPVIGVDSFVHCSDPKQQMELLHRNLDKFSWNPGRVKIIDRDSKSVEESELLSSAGAPISIFHVDGDHTAEGTIHDLKLASSVLESKGLLILDDISNLSCPGVVEAAVKFCSENKKIAPFLITSNKLFLATSECVDYYREELYKECQSGRLGENGRHIVEYRQLMKSLKIPVHLCGSEVLVPRS